MSVLSSAALYIEERFLALLGMTMVLRIAAGIVSAARLGGEQHTIMKKRVPIKTRFPIESSWMRRLRAVLGASGIALAVLCVGAAPVWASIAMVQHKGTAGTSNASVSVTPASSVTAGNLMFVFASVFSSSTGQPLWANKWFPVSDTAGNTWYACSFVQANVGNSRLSSIGSVCFWAIANSTGSDTVSVALDSGIGSQQLTIQYREYSGVDAVTPIAFGTLKSSGLPGGSPGTSASTTITPEDSGSLIIGCMPWETTTVVPTSSTLSNLEVDPSTGDTATHNPMVCADNTNALAASTTASFSFGSTSESYDLFVLVFRPAGAHSSAGGKLVNVGAADDLTTADTTQSVTLSATTGNTIILPLTLAGWSSGVSISSVKDDLGNNFSLSHTCAQDTTHGKFTCVYYLSNVTGGSRTFTVTVSGGTCEIEMHPMQVQGIGALLTANVGTSSTGQTVNAPSLTITQNAFFAWEVTVQAEYWQPDVAHAAWWGTSSDNNGSQYSDNLAAGTYTPNSVTSSNSWWLAAGAAFAQSSGGGGGGGTAAFDKRRKLEKYEQ